MKNSILISFLFFSANILLATNYPSTGNGQWTSVGMPGGGSSWWDSNASYDTIFVEHDVFTSGGYSLGSNSDLVLYIKSSATLTINGNFSVNNTNIYIEDGGVLDITGSFSTSNTTPRMDVLGTMKVGNGMQQIKETWYIGPNGSLEIVGDFTNDNSAFDFVSDGNVSVTGDANFHSGNLSFGSSSIFTALGDLMVGHADIVNDGAMNFPNASSVTTWSGDYDCDGNGSGTVVFGGNVNCSSACSSSSGDQNGGCYSNGSVPLPIELLSFNVTNTENQFVFD